MGSPGSLDRIGVSAWESRSDADTYNTYVYPQLLKVLADTIIGRPGYGHLSNLPTIRPSGGEKAKGKRALANGDLSLTNAWVACTLGQHPTEDRSSVFVRAGFQVGDPSARERNTECQLLSSRTRSKMHRMTWWQTAPILHAGFLVGRFLADTQQLASD